MANASTFIAEAIARLPDPDRKPRNESDKSNLACVSRYIASIAAELDQGSAPQVAAERSAGLLSGLNTKHLSALEWTAYFLLQSGVEMMRHWSGEAGEALEAFLKSVIQTTEQCGRKLSHKELLNAFLDHATPMLEQLCIVGLWTEESLKKSALKARFANLAQVEKELKLIAQIVSKTGQPFAKMLIK